MQESIDEYRCALEDIADCADLCKICRDRQMTIRITAGLRDTEIRSKILALRPYPNLQKAIDVARAEEDAAHDKHKIKMGSGDINRVDNRSRSKSRDKWKKTDSTDKKDEDDKNRCSNCGYKHRDGQECPAKKDKCRSCGKTGHYERRCRKGDQSKSVGALKACRITSDNFAPVAPITLTTKKGKVSVRALPDTGADESLMDVDTLRSLGDDPHNIEASKWLIRAANGGTLRILGEITVKVQYFEQTLKVRFGVTDQYSGVLLSAQASAELGIVQYDPRLKVAQSGKVASASRITGTNEKLIQEYKDVFNGEGQLQTQHGPPMKIELVEDAKPFAVNGARAIPFAHREEVERKLNEMVAKGIIAPVTEPTAWCHPLVVVPKKDGGVCICVDLTKLNQYVKRPTHPVRTPKDVVSNIPVGMNYFTTLDAVNGYWQLELEPESQLLTTFATPWGRFKYLRGAMGLVSTGDIYGQKGDEAFHGMPGIGKVVG